MAAPHSPPKESLPHIIVDDKLPNPFNKLAIETTQQIAEYLDGDSDLCNFQAVCSSTRNAVAGDNCSLWRRRFHSRFEPTGWSQRDNTKYKDAYCHRRRLLKHGANFKEGRSKDERECLEMLKELIIESFTNKDANDTKHLYESANLENLIRFAQNTDILKIIFKPAKHVSRYTQDRCPPRTEAVLYTIQVICAPILLSLDPHLTNDHFGFPDSQQAVYSSVQQQPFFGGRCGLDINIELVLHNINFWKYHMTRPVEQTLYTAFSGLESDERPQWWDAKLQQGTQTLGKHWKGSYAYLDPEEIEQIRGMSGGYDGDNIQFQDKFAGEDHDFEFQNMQLEVIPDKEMKWPAAFERHLNSLSPPPPYTPPGVRTRAQKRGGSGGIPEDIAAFKPMSFRFDGGGDDEAEDDRRETFFASGWMNPLPTQQGIPGWKRLTMMKYFDILDASAGAGATSNNEDWWAYEGVVLPGGKVVVGRWRSPSTGTGAEQYSGPFILWCVDGSVGYEGYEDMVEVGGGGAVRA